MVIYNLIGRRRRSAVRNKTACKCFYGSILARMPDFFVKFWIEININISNERNFSAVYRSLNYIGSLAKFSLHATRCSLYFDKQQKNEIYSLITVWVVSNKHCLLSFLCPATRKWRGIMLYPPKF